MGKHWTQKLKEENALLKRDIKRIVNGDFYTSLIYKTRFRFEDNIESMIWQGSSRYQCYKCKSPISIDRPICPTDGERYCEACVNG